MDLKNMDPSAIEKMKSLGDKIEIEMQSKITEIHQQINERKIKFATEILANTTEGLMESKLAEIKRIWIQVR